MRQAGHVWWDENCIAVAANAGPWCGWTLGGAGNELGKTPIEVVSNVRASVHNFDFHLCTEVTVTCEPTVQERAAGRTLPPLALSLSQHFWSKAQATPDTPTIQLESPHPHLLLRPPQPTQALEFRRHRHLANGFSLEPILLTRSSRTPRSNDRRDRSTERACARIPCG
jgi:hypothetical protein